MEWGRRCCVWASLVSCECFTLNCDVYTSGGGWEVWGAWGGVSQLRKNAEMLIVQAINQFSAGTATPGVTRSSDTWQQRQLGVAMASLLQGCGGAGGLHYGYPHWKSPEQQPPPSPSNTLYIIKTCLAAWKGRAKIPESGV